MSKQGKGSNRPAEAWMPVRNISNGTVILDNNEKVTGVKVTPRNIFILDEDAQQNVIRGLSNFYNTIDFEFWLLKRKSFLHQLCDPRHTHIDLRNLIPGWEIHHSRHRQIKNPLKCFHRFPGSFPENTICGNGWNGRVCLRNPCKLLLHLPHFCSGRSNCQIRSRPGRWNSCYLLRGIDINAASVIITQNLNRTVTLISQIPRSPLSHPPAAGYIFTITILC